MDPIDMYYHIVNDLLKCLSKITQILKDKVRVGPCLPPLRAKEEYMLQVAVSGLTDCGPLTTCQ